MINRANAIIAEKSWKYTLQNLAIGQHVGNAAGDAQIVFQYGETTIWQADEIGSADAHINPTRDCKPAHLAPKMLAAVDQLAWNDSVRQNVPLVVDVIEKKIQSGDSLRESSLDLLPLISRNDSRQQVVGEDTFSSLFVSVHRERDSLVEKGQVGRLLALAQLLSRQFEQSAKKALVVRARDTGRFEHFVISALKLVV